jgi:hypothetical protein
MFVILVLRLSVLRCESMRTLKQRVIKALEEHDDYTENGRTYFKESGSVFWLPTEIYKKRKERWKNGLSIGAYEPIWIAEEKRSKIKIETVYSSNCAFCVKIIDPDNYFDDEHDILFKKSLADSRGNILTQDEIDAWEEHRQERNPWLDSFLAWFKGWLHRETSTNEPNENIGD